jgi:hypothetical protein
MSFHAILLLCAVTIYALPSISAGRHVLRSLPEKRKSSEPSESSGTRVPFSYETKSILLNHVLMHGVTISVPDRARLALISGLTEMQVSQWFSNYRKREHYPNHPHEVPRQRLQNPSDSVDTGTRIPEIIPDGVLQHWWEHTFGMVKGSSDDLLRYALFSGVNPPLETRVLLSGVTGLTDFQVESWFHNYRMTRAMQAKVRDAHRRASSPSSFHDSSDIDSAAIDEPKRTEPFSETNLKVLLEYLRFNGSKPTNDDLEVLSSVTGISRMQVSEWFRYYRHHGMHKTTENLQTTSTEGYNSRPTSSADLEAPLSQSSASVEASRTVPHDKLEFEDSRLENGIDASSTDSERKYYMQFEDSDTRYD